MRLYASGIRWPQLKVLTLGATLTVSFVSEIQPGLVLGSSVDCDVLDEKPILPGHDILAFRGGKPLGLELPTTPVASLHEPHAIGVV